MEELHIESSDLAVLLTYRGELTLEVCTGLKKRLDDILLENHQATSVVADLSKTTFLDSSGIGFLVALNNRMQHEGRGFYMFRPSDQVRKTLQLVRLLNYFTLMEDDASLQELLGNT